MKDLILKAEFNTQKGVYKKFFLKGLKPPERLTVSEWADKYRVLSKISSAEPGKWRTSRTPYLREIMDCLSAHSRVNEVVVMKAAQLGFTETGVNWIGYIMDHAPGPTLMVQITDESVRKVSRQRIDPLIDATPELKAKVNESKSRDSSNTIRQKDFHGGTLVMTGASSGTGLRSMPAQYLFLDEIDGYPHEVDGEGDPVALAEARTRTFPRRKVYKVSTPTIDGYSKIQIAFEASDQRYFKVPCPHCAFMQVLKFSNLKWLSTDSEVFYACENCGEFISENAKAMMLAQGVWVPTCESDIRGFHISSLYCPPGWYTWQQIRDDWLKAQKNKDQLRTFVNTVLGETWKEKGEAPEWERLYERRNHYPFNTVAIGGIFVTAGVDVQRDRLEVEIKAWGRNLVSYSVDYRVIMGDTSQDSVWHELDKLAVETFEMRDGRGRLPIKAIAIDSGFNTQKVYAYVRTKDPMRFLAVKGQDGLTQNIGSPKAVDVDIRGRIYRRGAKYWPVGSSVIKSEIYQFLKQNKPLPGEPIPVGYCFHPDYGPDYFKMLTAEELVSKKLRGYIKREWVKIRERNEALDCHVYNRAAASALGIDRFQEKDWLRLEKEILPNNTINERSIKNNASLSIPKVKVKRVVREGGFL